MSRNSKALFHFFILDFRFSVLVFWSIFTASLLPLIILSLTTDSTIIISSSMAIGIFCAISGFLMTKETFSFSIRLGVTRQEYVGTGILFSAVLALFMSATGQFIVLLLSLVTDSTASTLSFLQVADFFATDPSWIIAFAIDFTLTFFFFITGFFLSSIFHRYGMIGGMTGLTILFILLVFPSSRDLIGDIFFLSPTEEWLFPLNYIGIFSIIAAMSALIWLMLRRASIMPGVTR
ncbi:hypothetical protein [Jeotgalibacillus proteolyticus]|uniref:hypothetical protein n=1 Tax=Jeotgalibacillus proteolyticus TaxID=2082395 RepID=UPI003CF3D9B2